MILYKNRLRSVALFWATLFSFISLAANTTDKPAYMLYTDEGLPSSFHGMIDNLAESDVIFIGEYHNSSLIHWLEYEIFNSLADKLDNKVTLGMEMFEADTQLKVDEYMSGLICEERFLAETYLWANYKMDYAPIVKSAKERGIRLISTNIPRRYARAVSTDGIEILRRFPESSQKFYSEVIERVEAIKEPDNFFAKASAMSVVSKSDDKKKMSEKVMRMTQAQALKDAVMANSISKNLKYPFVHINGNYHSDYNKGIITYLKESNPSLKIMTVTTVYQDDLSSLDEKNKGKADYYIVLPTDTHKTF